MVLVLTMVYGPSWDVSRQIRKQDAWDGHADSWADSLTTASSSRRPGRRWRAGLHIVEATGEREITVRLGEDPWASMGLLRIGAIAPAPSAQRRAIGGRHERCSLIGIHVVLEVFVRAVSPVGLE